jgi:hypothetical protein
MGRVILGIIIGVVVTIILWNLFDGPLGLLGLGASALAFLGG